MNGSHPEPGHNDSSLRGNDRQRRPREIHKLRLPDLAGLSHDDISRMIAGGDIELMVRPADVIDPDEGGWNGKIAKLFAEVATCLDGMPEHENRTIFVNFVAGGGKSRS